MKPLKIALQLGAVALVLALLGLFAWKVSRGSEVDARVGEPAPAFDLPALSGSQRVNIDRYRGRPMLINFWATWCGPCRDEAPALERAWRRYRSQGIVFIGVDIRDFTGDARRFVDRYSLTYPIAYDGPAKLWAQWGLTGLPETFLVDRDGRIVEHRIAPYDSESDLHAAIEKALA